MYNLSFDLHGKGVRIFDPRVDARVCLLVLSRV